jgi:SAM-dependent methyltransferase
VEPVDRASGEYGLANAWDQPEQRLRAIERWLDPGTTRVLAALGVRPGWRCWEAGAGAGSVARWLAGAVGPEGQVIASDLDPSSIADDISSAMRVIEHDVANDPPPDGPFDLVHCRLLLAYLPDRRHVLEQMASVLKPGGCVMVEEMDFVAVATDAGRDGGTALVESVAASNAVLVGRGFDPWYGRRLHDDLNAVGLVGVASDGRCQIWNGGSSGARAWQLTFEQLRDEMVAGGTSPLTIDTAIGVLADPTRSFMSQVTMAAWGFR